MKCGNAPLPQKVEYPSLPWRKMAEKLPPIRRHLLLFTRNGTYQHGMCLKKDGGVLVDGTTYPLARYSDYLVCTPPGKPNAKAL